ncbi:hypothetical protein KCQ_05591 [Pectobacterium atrosepticum ICMP 1526]|uniref:hypothetical protein n=1 Tax=Pectobacterium atrosepticum TaxID=29471 RepID=UPI00050159D6|nr:hypothetical protein [Pectobacterium atrosepticum]KFX10711.1 hypothetical protein JV34_22570 [Pectobacterium atrosepticum]KMK87257.1 hypothetical protein KCQ_05591 [Pectobacterium atrosepticum ICMP 1526]
MKTKIIDPSSVHATSWNPTNKEQSNSDDISFANADDFEIVKDIVSKAKKESKFDLFDPFMNSFLSSFVVLAVFYAIFSAWLSNEFSIDPNSGKMYAIYLVFYISSVSLGLYISDIQRKDRDLRDDEVEVLLNCSEVYRRDLFDFLKKGKRSLTWSTLDNFNESYRNKWYRELKGVLLSRKLKVDSVKH